MQYLPCEKAQRRYCIFSFQPHSGCKNIHDIGTPLQLPGKLFPQDIVTATALEKSLVVFHGKIQGAVPVQASAEAAPASLLG